MTLFAIVVCETSGVVREALRAVGVSAWSTDILPSDDRSPYHFIGDLRLRDARFWRQFDLMIAHPPCTRLTNSGVRWLSERDLWAELDEACAFYRLVRDLPVPLKAIENPVWHCHAKERLGWPARQFVQPWQFGDPFFKRTGFELTGLPRLVPTDVLTPPEKGTEEHKRWSMVHRASPGKDRWKVRSRTFPGLAKAMAEQWGVKR